MTNYKAIDKKNFTQAQIEASFADADGRGLFATAVREYSLGSKAKGVWATVQAGYDMAAQFYTTHNGEIPVGVIDTRAFGKLADELAK